MPDNEKINLGKLLKERRCDLKYTQREIAGLIGLSTGLYQKYEYNVCRPSFEKTLKIFYYLHLSLDKITDEYMESKKDGKDKKDKKNMNFTISKIKRDAKYSAFIKNNFHYKKRKKVTAITAIEDQEITIINPESSFLESPKTYDSS